VEVVLLIVTILLRNFCAQLDLQEHHEHCEYELLSIPGRSPAFITFSALLFDRITLVLSS
jgi:hypothetical protein